MNINICHHCNRFFINYGEYEHYRDEYGIIGNLKMVLGNGSPGSIPLADQSTLKLCGYTVNQIDNLSSEQRQRILAQIIDGNIMSKAEIIDYLHMFIRYNGVRYHMNYAVEKWKEDLKFVRDYRINEQENYSISRIKGNR